MEVTGTPEFNYLDVLPLSSPSSEEDSSVLKAAGRSTAEFLFDQIRNSTPVYDSGVPVEEELDISQVQAEEVGGSSSLLRKQFSSSDRKRAAPDSGYLSDQTEGSSALKRRAKPQPLREDPNSPLTEGSTKGAESPEEEVGLSGGIEDSGVKMKGALMESGVESDLTSGIAAAFSTFKTHLEQHFTNCWQNVEGEVLLSLKECQQHVSSLLTAVHQHRLVLLQRFHCSVSDHLNQLQENSTNLNSVNTQILSFFQSEMQRLGSFCDEHLQRLISSETEQPPSQ